MALGSSTNSTKSFSSFLPAITSPFFSSKDKNGLVIAGRNDEKDLVEFVELPKAMHPYFVGTQAHPEFKSKFMKPAPLFMGLLQAAKERRLGSPKQKRALTSTPTAQ